MSDYAHRLLLSDALRETTIRAAIKTLAPAAGGRGLDAGCGIGSHTLMLAEALGELGRMVGVDLSSEMLALARRRASEVGLESRVTFEPGDLLSLSFDDDSFDFAWSVDCAGYAPIDPVAAIGELARVVRPGGQVAILAWSSERLLPGYPELEARLAATSAGMAPFARGSDPTRHFMRGTGWFRQVGLCDVSAQSLLGDVCAPLDDRTREAMTSLLQMRWDGAKSELQPGDRELYVRLTDSESPEHILACPDYCALFTYTMFRGTVGS